MAYSHVVLGGTFDHFHEGHRDLLSLAFQSGKKVTLGLTKPAMNRTKKYATAIQPYRMRGKEIRDFATKMGRIKDLRIIPITDIYGTTLIDNTLDAIIVTPHTKDGADHINAERTKIGMGTLPVVVCNLREDQKGEVLCSTNIRAGLCDRTGFRYDLLLSKSHTISDKSREVLRRPFGKTIHAFKLRRTRSPLVLIGDVVTHFCIQHDISFSCAYIDGQSQRKPYVMSFPASTTLHETAISNPAGMITREIASHISTYALLGKKSMFRLHGEEDLLTVASVLLLPLGTKIVYGYPFTPKGMRCITVTARIKQIFANLVY